MSVSARLVLELTRFGTPPLSDYTSGDLAKLYFIIVQTMLFVLLPRNQAKCYTLLTLRLNVIT